MRAHCKKIHSLFKIYMLKKSLLIKKKNLSNYYANICFLKSVWWARKLFNLAPNISALVLNCRRSDDVAAPKIMFLTLCPNLSQLRLFHFVNPVKP